MMMERPDTEIVLFPDPGKNVVVRRQILQNLKSAQGLVLHLAESVQGNVFNRPFPYIVLRSVEPHERLPENLDEGDGMKDFYFTLRSVRRDKGETIGFIFLGFKVIKFFIRLISSHINFSSLISRLLNTSIILQDSKIQPYNKKNLFSANLVCINKFLRMSANGP